MPMRVVSQLVQSAAQLYELVKWQDDGLVVAGHDAFQTRV